MSPVPLKFEAEWTPGAVWRNAVDKTLACARNRDPVAL